jgi:mannose-1-phosphate guanylyltransferase/mannose-6-phosphate isomerase
MSFVSEDRPWGRWQVVHEEAAATVKILTVEPGQMLSLQSHENRDELWQPLGPGLVRYTTREDGDMPNAEVMSEGKVYAIRRNMRHRLINPTEFAVSVVEVIKGRYDESDIIRYQDAYGRK